ncbi:RING/U-box superfamily protein, putative isoform 1 [Hibiscus syriacus]|uniref:RING/U-box superfamily protein, putative isoform 1 n=1 Tax=Hibiscus syriacus TaxID=106335 RepID=A0A6A3CKU7_HIBSY|nr:RING/U-box superfamily protein, putative isoform 1 [Hibiscus syriacus]
MATRTVGLIQNQNLNARFNGKTNVFKAQRKAGSNSGKPYSQGTSKKNQKAKLGNPEEDLCQLEDISEEGCRQNHEDCIKTQKRAISTNDFLRILGLDDFSKHSASAKEYSLSNILEPMSPPRYAESKQDDCDADRRAISSKTYVKEIRLFCS